MSDEENEIDLKIRFNGKVHELFDVPVGLSNRELLIQIITEICPHELSKIPKLKLANKREISFAKPKFNLKKFIRRFGGGEGVVRGVLEFGEQKKIEKESKKNSGKIQELEKAQENLQKELDEKKVEVKNLKKRLLQENKKVEEKYKAKLKKTTDEFNKQVRRLKETRKDIDSRNEREQALEKEVRKLKVLLKQKELRLRKLLKFKAESEKVTVKLRKKEIAFAEPLFKKHPILLEALTMCSAFYFVKKHAAEYFAKFGVRQVPLWRICTFCCEVRRRCRSGSKDINPGRSSDRCRSTSCLPFCCMCLFTNMGEGFSSWKCGGVFTACKPILIPQEFRKFPSKRVAENCVLPTQTYENSSYWFKGDRAKLYLENKRERKVSSLIERRIPVVKWDDYLADCNINLSFSSLAARLEKGCDSDSGSNKSTFIIINPFDGEVTCFDNSIEIGKQQLLKYVGRKKGQNDPRKVFLLSTEGMVSLEIIKKLENVKDLRYGKNIVPLIWCELHSD